ncbi:MAG: hypothetical protein U0R17_00780 [Acidimicrobiia bacterium]
MSFIETLEPAGFKKPNGTNFYYSDGIIINASSKQPIIYFVDEALRPFDSTEKYTDFSLTYITKDDKGKLAWIAESANGSRREKRATSTSYGHKSHGLPPQYRGLNGLSIEDQLKIVGFELIGTIGKTKLYDNSETGTAVVINRDGVATIMNRCDTGTNKEYYDWVLKDVTGVTSVGSDGLKLSTTWGSITLDSSGAPKSNKIDRVPTLEDFGIVWNQKIDGEFVHYGANTTNAIQNLETLNGTPIEIIELRMRPGSREGIPSKTYWHNDDKNAPKKEVYVEGSGAGFLGEHDSLLETIARDNDLVQELGFTHQELAEMLLRATNIRKLGTHNYGLLSPNVNLGGKKIEITYTSWMGYQYSPFGDGKASDTDFKIASGRTSLVFSELVPDMIAEFGFYEGPGTSYRLAPEDIITFFPELLARTSTKEVKAKVKEVNSRYPTFNDSFRRYIPGRNTPSSTSRTPLDRISFRNR